MDSKNPHTEGAGASVLNLAAETEAPTTPARLDAIARRAPLSGADLAREGAALCAVLLPDRSTRRAAGRRIYRRARKLIDSGDERQMMTGFFLFGLAEAASGRAI